MAHMQTPLTDEQVKDLQACLYEWQRIRVEGGSDAKFTAVDVEKSCLLGRMTIAGKEPLPFAPPTAYSAPWYRLIDDNGADLHGGGHGFSDVYGPISTPHWLRQAFPDCLQMVNICQDMWGVRRGSDAEGYVLIHRTTPGEWLLRHRRVADPPAKAGSSIASGKPETLWMTVKDWRLEGPPTPLDTAAPADSIRTDK